MSRRLPVLLVLLLAVVLAGCGTDAVSTATPEPTVTGDPGVPADGETREATITRVVDGDTIEVRYADGTTDTVRLVGIDTPETHGDTDPAEFEGVPENESGRACLADAGEHAASALKTWVDGAEVSLVVDPRTDTRDRYDRLLAYVVHEGSNVNYRLVSQGYARVYDTEFTRADQFYAAESEAQQVGRGVWHCAAPSSRDATDGLGVRVVADAPGNDNENLNGEFVVIENGASESRSIGGWTVSDEADHTYTFPTDATIPSGRSIRLYTGSGTNNATAFYWDSNGAVWNNGGDTVTVENSNGTVVVKESY